MTNLSLDMNSHDLMAWIAEHGPVHVVFSEGAENLEAYPEAGIQGLLTQVKDDNDEVHRWILDYTAFEVINSLHESAIYRGGSPGSPGYLQCYASISYKPVNDTLYINPSDKLHCLLQSICPAASIEVDCDAVEQRFASLQQALG